MKRTLVEAVVETDHEAPEVRLGGAFTPIFAVLTAVAADARGRARLRG
jgi:hypothetical protein